MKKILVVGQGGREASIAKKLSFDSTVFSFMGHKNPTILKYVQQTGGQYELGDINNGQLIADFSKRAMIDLVFVNSDNPLAAGVVDILMSNKIPVIGPSKSGAEIEWNKIYALQLMKELFPEYTPRFWLVSNKNELKSIVDILEKNKIPVVVKPQGLTGGKGVKVMGEHLVDYQAVFNYALEVLDMRKQVNEKVVLVEKMTGIEFTVMGLTDGINLVCAPATYDHPYRLDGDKGPGTGGMGSFNDKNFSLPFMDYQEYKLCEKIMKSVLLKLKSEGRHFQGVLNGGFFLTEEGLKFMEFNARFGDPECMNVMLVLDTPFSEILNLMYNNNLTHDKVIFKKQASVVKYLVSPEYGYKKGPTHDFIVDEDALNKNGIEVFFASAEAIEKNFFRTIGTSRSLALACTAETIQEASKKINNNVLNFVSGTLELRKDIGSQEELDQLIHLKKRFSL